MGLSNGVVLRGDIEYSDAYVNINSYVIDKKNKRMTVQLSAYKTQELSESNGDLLSLSAPTLFFRIESEIYDQYFSDSVLSGEGVSLEKQIYAYIRGEHTEEFSSFTDVM